MKISVILPVYNVEKYLSECLESLINQTYKDLEFICVNDCSTDMSEQILNHYAKTDHRFIVVNNNKNIGSGMSRNRGLSIAKGDFVHFLDPDDWIELNTYEKLVNIIKKNKNVDVIRFTLETFNENNKMYETSESIPEGLLGKIYPVFNEPKCIYYWSTSACIKLIKRKFINDYNLKFNSYKSQEDIEFSIKLLLANPTVLFLNKTFLKYRINRKNSLTSKRILYTDSLLNDVKYVNERANNLPEEIGNQLKNIVQSYHQLESQSVNLIDFIKNEDALDEEFLTLLNEEFENFNHWKWSKGI